MRAISSVLLVAVLGGCTSVRLVQRDGCWVRQTEKWPSRVNEEIGPCTPPRAQWSDDRLTRVVQECIARADYHWQTRALLAWDKGEALPERDSETTVVQQCMDETSRALASDNDRLKQQNDTLQTRLKEVGSEREVLRARADDAGARLLASQERVADRLFTAQDKLGERLLNEQDKMAGYLGEAAKKASQPAVATATANSSSDGSATTDSSATAPPATVIASVPVSRSGAEPKARAARQARSDSRKATRSSAAACPPGSTSAQPAGPEQDGREGVAAEPPPAAGGRTARIPSAAPAPPVR